MSASQPQDEMSEERKAEFENGLRELAKLPDGKLRLAIVSFTLKHPGLIEQAVLMYRDGLGLDLILENLRNMDE